MSFFVLLVFIYIFYTSCLGTDALLQEELVSDQFAPENVFTYQVAIMTKGNYTNSSSLRCGGGIISPNKILTAAQCFVDEHGNHIALTFSIIANKIDLKISKGDEISINQIFLVSQGPYYIHDISVASLAQTLDFVKNPDLSILHIPTTYEKYRGHIGTVAGHGYYYAIARWVTEGDPLDSHFRRICGGSDCILRFFRARILRHKECIAELPDPLSVHVFCGLPMDVPPDISWGICAKDAGSAFVINNTVVGIASSSNKQCDDTLYGGVYTKTSYYANFISAILRDDPLDYTIVYNNRHHKQK